MPDDDGGRELRRRLELDDAIARAEDGLAASPQWFALDPGGRRGKGGRPLRVGERACGDAGARPRAPPRSRSPPLMRRARAASCCSGRCRSRRCARAALADAIDFPARDRGRAHDGRRAAEPRAQRWPVAALEAALASGGWRVEIHGVPAGVFEQFELGGADCEKIALEYDAISRGVCARRPAFYRSAPTRTLFCAVTSGADYVLHYASLLRYALVELCAGAGAAVDARVVRYPEMERQLCEWTAHAGSIQPGDTVVYGYAEGVLAHLRADSTLEPRLEALNVFENEHYRSERVRLGERVLNFYACKEHGWGNISAVTMRCARPRPARSRSCTSPRARRATRPTPSTSRSTVPSAS